MAEKTYFFNLGNASVLSIKSDLSGIVKRVRISKYGDWSIADDGTGSWRLQITPELDSYALTNKVKFAAGQVLALDANPSGRHIETTCMSFDVNFYIDKADYVVMRNAVGATCIFSCVLDIVPVSDKTRLYLGGEYHNQ